MKTFNRVELEDILSDLKPKIDSNKENLIIDCPFCNQRECSISINSNLWGCFRKKQCGETGNIFKILQKIGKLKKLIKSSSDFIKNDKITINSSLLNFKQIINKNIDDEDLNNIESENVSLPLGWTRTYNNDYLNNRGFINYENYPVGISSMDPLLRNDYIIFLVNEKNETKGWVGRHIWDKQKIENYNQQYFLQKGFKNKIKRYRNSSHTNFSKLLYGYDELDENNPKPVCLVEGIFDKHAIDKKMYLIDHQWMNCLATFKCFVSDYQILKLKQKNVTDIILFYDPDVIREIQKNVLKLEIFFNIKIIISNINKDPDELTRDELFNCFESNIYNPHQIKNNFKQVKKLFI
jgi:hypothetical protein